MLNAPVACAARKARNPVEVVSDMNTQGYARLPSLSSLPPFAFRAFASSWSNLFIWTMAEAKEFKPLKELGAVALGESAVLKFYVDEFKGHRYGSIRTFVTGEAYSGPTKAGVTLNARLLDEAIPVLESLPSSPAGEDKELLRLPKKPGVEFVIRVTWLKDAAGIDLREWGGEDGVQGWSKKGVRVPYKDLGAMLGYLREMKALVAKP